MIIFTTITILTYEELEPSDAQVVGVWEAVSFASSWSSLY